MQNRILRISFENESGYIEGEIEFWKLVKKWCLSRDVILDEVVLTYNERVLFDDDHDVMMYDRIMKALPRLSRIYAEKFYWMTLVTRKEVLLPLVLSRLEPVTLFAYMSKDSFNTVTMLDSFLVELMLNHSIRMISYTGDKFEKKDQYFCHGLTLEPTEFDVDFDRIFRWFISSRRMNTRTPVEPGEFEFTPMEVAKRRKWHLMESTHSLFLSYLKKLQDKGEL